MVIAPLIKRFGTRAALAAAMGVSRQTVWAWERAGRLPALRCPQAREILARNRK